MKKFEFRGKEFELDYDNDITPIIIAKEIDNEKIDLKKLKEEYKDCKIFHNKTHFYDENTKKLRDITYYYVGAKCINSKKYKSIEYYDHNSPPKNMILEITLQEGNYKKTFYKKMKNSNCCMTDLIDISMEEIKEDILKEQYENYNTLFLYDDGGLQLQIDVDEREIETLITSIRLVEEVTTTCTQCCHYIDNKCTRIGINGEKEICWMEKTEGEY